MSTTTERLIRLIDKDAVSSQKCAADVLGVSKQRVHQIVHEEGLSLGRTLQRNTLISWPCPGCGAAVRMWTKARSVERTTYCRSCSARRFAGVKPTGRRCTVPHCENAHQARGYCHPHYYRWRRYGDAVKGKVITPVPACSAEDCSARSHTRGFCRLHYTRSVRGSFR